MKLNQLYYFKCVCKYNNITKAANELHISQPAVTKAIHEIEEELGVVLLQRTNKNVRLTNEGQLFLNRSTAILSDLESLIDEMKDLGDMRRTSIRIGVPPAIGTIVLPQLSSAAQEEFGLELEIFDHMSDDAIRAVENDELDLAIVLLDDTFYPNIDSAVMKETSFCFCTNRRNPLAKEKAIRISQLESERIIFFHPGELIHSLFKKYAVTPKYILRSNQVITIRNYINANLASTMQFPEAFARDPEVVAIPLADPLPLTIAVVKKRGKRQFSGVAKLYQYLSEYPDKIIHC